MFNKEKSKNNVSCKTKENILLKKVGSFLLTLTLINSIPITSIADTMDDHADYYESIFKYEEKVAYNLEHKKYDDGLCQLYRNGQFLLEDKLYSTGNVYIACGYENGNLAMHLVCLKVGKKDLITNEEYNMSDITLIKLVDTTSFIELLEKKLLLYTEDAILSFDKSRSKEIIDVINNWNGMYHRFVPELDALDDLEVVKVKK